MAGSARKRILVSVLLAGLVVLAGCSGGTGAGTPATDAADSTEATLTTVPENTPTEAETATPTPTYSFADKYVASDGYYKHTIDSRSTYHLVHSRHLIENVETYTVSMTRLARTGEGEMANLTKTFKRGEKASYMYFDPTRDQSYHFYMDREDDTTTVRSLDNGKETGVNTESGLRYTDETVFDYGLPTKAAKFKFTGYTESNGEPKAVFVADGPTEALKSNYPNADSVTGKIVINENGVIERMVVHVENSDGKTLYHFSFTVSGINSTSVEKPSWVDS